jgi:hypothetical protein
MALNLIPHGLMRQPHTLSAAKGENMRQRKIIKTTLGELIVAVTDEVMPVIGDRSGLYRMVSFILSDLLAHHQVRVSKKVQMK